MHRIGLSAVSVVLFLVAFLLPAIANQRVALVVGNSAYVRAPHLINPINDAEDVASALKRSGFEVIIATNLSKVAMEEAFISFSRVTREADVAMFYYAGHALQFGGVNYLVPVDAQLKDEADLRRLVRLDDIVADVQQAKNLRIIVLDACRDNPLADQLRRSIGASRSAYIGRGLAKMDSPLGTIIAYATQAGRTADDGDGRNSPFTTAFLNNLERKEEIGTVFRRISVDVYQSTRQKQLPEISLSLIGEFYLNGRLPIDTGGTPAPVPVNPCDEAQEHWTKSDLANTKSSYEEHLARFPACSFATFARAKIAALSLPEPDIRRFDGNWIGKLVCEPTFSGVPGWNYELIGKVKNGVFHAERGQVGKPGSEVFHGAIEADGSAVIIRKALTGPDDVFRRKPNIPYNQRYLTIFEGARASGVRSDRSTCYFNFTKR